MKIHLVGKGSEAFVELLDESEIEYVRHHPRPGQIVAGGEWLELIREVIPWGALATVIVSWINSTASREVQIELDDRTIFRAKGMSEKEIARHLERTKSLMAFDTKPESKPSKKNKK